MIMVYLQYLFLLHVPLPRKGAEDLDGRLLSIMKCSDLHRHHIFPKEIFNSQKEDYVSSLGNVTFAGEPFMRMSVP